MVKTRSSQNNSQGKSTESSLVKTATQPTKIKHKQLPQSTKIKRKQLPIANSPAIGSLTTKSPATDSFMTGSLTSGSLATSPPVTNSPPTSSLMTSSPTTNLPASQSISHVNNSNWIIAQNVENLWQQKDIVGGSKGKSTSKRVLQEVTNANTEKRSRLEVNDNINEINQEEVIEYPSNVTIGQTTSNPNKSSRFFEGNSKLTSMRKKDVLTITPDQFQEAIAMEVKKAINKNVNKPKVKGFTISKLKQECQMPDNQWPEICIDLLVHQVHKDQFPPHVRLMYDYVVGKILEKYNYSLETNNELFKITYIKCRQQFPLNRSHMKEHLVKKFPILFPEISFNNVTQLPLPSDAKKTAVEIANRQRDLIEPLGHQYRFLFEYDDIHQRTGRKFHSKWIINAIGLLFTGEKARFPNAMQVKEITVPLLATVIMLLEYLITAHGRRNMTESEMRPRYRAWIVKIKEFLAANPDGIDWDFLLSKSQKVESSMNLTIEYDDDDILQILPETVNMDIPDDIPYYKLQ